MRVRLRVLVPGTPVRIRHPGPDGRGLWLVGGRVVGRGPDDPAYELHHVRSGRARVLRRSRPRLVRATSSTRKYPQMARRPPPTEHDAVARARAWLDRQHQRAHRQVLRLLRDAPLALVAEGICRAQVPLGEWSPPAARCASRD